MTITISTIGRQRGRLLARDGIYRDLLLRDRRCGYYTRDNDDGQPGAPRIPGMPRDHSRRLEAVRRRADHRAEFRA